ncbi:MAG: biotin/lipoyl-containing protein [Candidatus Binatia bacterium]
MAYVVELHQHTHRIELHPVGDSTFSVEIDGVAQTVDSRRIGQTIYSLLIDGRSVVADVHADGDAYTVAIAGEVFRMRVVDDRRRQVVSLGEPEEERGRHEIRALMPGKIVDILVQVGDVVMRDQGLLVIEAMKMENEVKSLAAGEIKEIVVKAGQAVEANQVLMVIE